MANVHLARGTDVGRAGSIFRQRWGGGLGFYGLLFRRWGFGVIIGRPDPPTAAEEWRPDDIVTEPMKPGEMTFRIDTACPRCGRSTMTNGAHICTTAGSW